MTIILLKSVFPNKCGARLELNMHKIKRDYSTLLYCFSKSLIVSLRYLVLLYNIDNGQSIINTVSMEDTLE